MPFPHLDWIIMQQQTAQNDNSFWVIGGAYADTGFQRVAGAAEERFGPYTSYAEAFKLWSRLAWQTVDDAHTRYRIEKS